MGDLTFGEQVKIILGRRGMTIKQLAELIEEKTGKKMSRQNLTQRLGRDNFQEQDMRMIAEILECPFSLSIMGGETQNLSRSAAVSAGTVSHEEAAVHEEPVSHEETVSFAEPVNVEPEAAVPAAEPEPETSAAEPEEIAVQPEESFPEPEEVSGEIQLTAEEAAPEYVPEEEASETAEAEEEQSLPEQSAEPAERDMTIGELYEIHEELSELEENIKAGENVENIKKELEKPRKERFRPGGIFLRRKNRDNEQEKPAAEEEREEAPVQAAAEPEEPEETAEESRDFEPVITHNDVEEDTVTGEVNPYTGREYQSNSVRMHPTRIGYVQVYDRTIHKWTDMTEWAFLGLQERKKALLGKAYEPPIYLD